MNAYDLFSAMNGADEALLARSEYRVKPRNFRIAPLLAAAACLAVILFSIQPIWAQVAPTVPDVPLIGPDTPGTEVTVPVIQPLQLSGGDVGTLNIVQLSQNTETTTMPDFLIYVNQENYYIGDGSGMYYIYPRTPSGDHPECKMEFTWRPDISAEDAMQEQAAALRASMEEVSDTEKIVLLEGMLLRSSQNSLPQAAPSETHSFLEGLMIHGSNGTNWDAEQRDIYVLSDGQGGVFIFTLQYYLEDTQGHAARFTEMLQTFEVISSPDQTPLWLSELLSAVMRMTPAFLTNEFSDVQDLLTGSSEIFTYGENVYPDTHICNIYYKVDNDRQPTSAYVSVRHKYLSPDAYDYITIDLSYTDGQWLVNWACVEP